MAYNLTDTEKQKSAARDTAIKMKREKKIQRALWAAYFIPIAKNLKRFYSQFGTVPHLGKHNDRLDKILNKNYRGTANKFLKQVRNALGTPISAMNLNAQIKEKSKLTQMVDVDITHNSIAITTYDSMHKVVNDAIIAAAVAGILLGNKQIAKKAHDDFLTESKGRLTTIGITQTQIAAEGAKRDELLTLVRNNAIFPKTGVDLSKDQVFKTWVPILDSRTRRAHAEADLQTVPFDEPYTVGGQKLKYPGDTSLGATVDNTINCRCSSVKSVRKV